MSRPPAGPQRVEGSAAARRLAVVLLEVLSGARGPQEGSQALGISLNRYYQLETRALQGFIRALEPLPRGKQKTPARQLADAEAEAARLRRELSRHQALLRAAQRSLGIKAAPKATLPGKGKGPNPRKRRRRTVRATKVIAAIRPAEAKSASGAPS